MKGVEIEVKPEDEKEKMYGDYDDYEIESAARTLQEAEEIKADPEKMKYVKMCMQKKLDGMNSALNSIDDLKAVAKKRIKEIEG